jgi:hypothetical protein
VLEARPSPFTRPPDAPSGSVECSVDRVGLISTIDSCACPVVATSKITAHVLAADDVHDRDQSRMTPPATWPNDSFCPPGRWAHGT